MLEEGSCELQPTKLQKARSSERLKQFEANCAVIHEESIEFVENEKGAKGGRKSVLKSNN